MTQFTILSSLRGRYALVAVIVALMILASVMFGHDYVDSSKENTTDHIGVRNELLQQSRMIREYVWQAREATEAFLLDPHKGNRGLAIIDAINGADRHAVQLSTNTWLREHRLENELDQISDSLQDLRAGAQLFIQTRLNAPEQYPALALARDHMLPAQSIFSSTVELAIDEISSAPEDPVLERLTRVRYLWSQMISNYRMYLANRVGSFDEATLPDQERDTELFLEQIANELAALAVHDKAGKLGFQGHQSLVEMQASLERWQQAYVEVKRLNASGNWRADAKIIQNQLDPVFRVIWQALVTIDQALELSANSDIETMSEVSRTLINAMWILAVVGLVVVAAGYVSLEFSVLRPVAQVAEALKSEAAGKSDFTLPASLSRETQDLVDAFTEMRNQVHSRQVALEHQATHDSLTGLVNRTGLNERLEQGISNAKRCNGALSLLIMDLNGFKDVNDTLGHQVGDELLKEVGLRLHGTLREMDTVCRLGGDEFAILLANTNEHQSELVAQKLLAAMQKNFTVHDQALYVGGSIGIASYPFHGKNPQMLTQRADVAMYVAKRNKSGYAVYDPTQDDHSIGRLALLSDLREALSNDGLELYYQPQIEIASERVMGAEALLRWKHPVHGFVPPNQIIPMAEQTGLIKQLSEWVLTKAFRQIRAWSDQGINLHLSVNLSVHNLQNDEIVQHVREGLREYHIDPQLLVLEITESAMMADPARAIEILSQLDDMQVNISIDDFGTGFSSLAYLKKLPVDELKVDRSFVMDMTADDNDAVIVRSTIDLAHNLGLKVVAEGVEDEQALELLGILRCDYAQGYHISRPVPVAQFDEWLANRQIASTPIAGSSAG